MNTAIAALAALAQETRLVLFRHLVQLGPKGAKVNEIRDRLDIPNATLSFHLATLKNAGLIQCRRNGRELIYSIDYIAMRNVLHYLTEDCCGGHPEICTDLNNIAAKQCG